MLHTLQLQSVSRLQMLLLLPVITTIIIINNNNNIVILTLLPVDRVREKGASPVLRVDIAPAYKAVTTVFQRKWASIGVQWISVFKGDRVHHRK